MDTSAHRPALREQLTAIAVVVLIAALVVMTLVALAGDLGRALAQIVLLGAVVFAAWYGITREDLGRVIAFVVGLVALVGFVLVGLARDGDPVSVVVRVVLLLLAIWLVRLALAQNVRALKESETPGTPVPAATHAVLIMNLKSGGGKAERFHLVDECRARGIEPVVLGPGDDLLDLAHQAVDRGADVIGMAGGDGSQALVAGIAAERGIPMVVIPAGTRNHLALDLGLDRDDVVGALDAFKEARERPMDLAEMNGRTFVNNVSLGLYAAIVRSPDYRDAKVDTTLATIPKVLAPNTEPFDLRFVGPTGEPHGGAHLIQISNNPYGSTLSTFGSRPRLDTGQLGIVSLEIRGDQEAAAFLAALTTGQPERFAGLRSWTSASFEVSSGGPIDIGLDGETLSLDPPLTFTMRPGTLRVRLPARAIGYSPAARAKGWRGAVRAVWRTALGKGTEPARTGAGSPRA